MNKSELKSELAKKYYSEDANCLSDFIDILDEYEKLTSYNSDYAMASPKLPSLTELCENLNGNLDLFHIEYIYKTIKKLGNFA